MQNSIAFLNFKYQNSSFNCLFRFIHSASFFSIKISNYLNLFFFCFHFFHYLQLKSDRYKREVNMEDGIFIQGLRTKLIEQKKKILQKKNRSFFISFRMIQKSLSLSSGIPKIHPHTRDNFLSENIFFFQIIF